MSFKLFGAGRKVSLQDFINKVKQGERDFHKILDTRPGEFTDASFEQLMSNPDDVIRKVNRVQMNFKKLYFGMFDHCLIKHTDDGDVKFTFYTTTDNIGGIKAISKILLDQFGPGFFDSKQYSSFREEDKIHAVASGRYVLPGDEPGQHWIMDDLSFALHYLASPPRQFMLDITINAPRQSDSSVRRKGTILDLLKLDPTVMLAQEPKHVSSEIINDKVKYIDYTYHLEQKEFDLFNAVEFRIFSDKREFNKYVQTHLTLFISGPAEADKKIAAVESLIRVYGSDNSNSGELEFYERDKLEEGCFWLGRTWRFNEAHAPWNMDNPEERMSYELRVDNMEEEESFRISISCYNNLVALFGLS